MTLLLNPEDDEFLRRALQGLANADIHWTPEIGDLYEASGEEMLEFSMGLMPSLERLEATLVAKEGDEEWRQQFSFFRDAVYLYGLAKGWCGALREGA